MFGRVSLTVGVFLAVLASEARDARAKCLPPPAGLVSWWTGDGTTRDIVGHNDGTLSGVASYTAGVVGQAFHFDGVTGMFLSPSAGLPPGSAARPLEGWGRGDQPPASLGASEAAFFGYGAFGTYTDTFAVGTAGMTSFFSQWGSAIDGPVLSLGAWHHIAAASRSSVVTLYVDGRAVSSSPFTMATPSGTQFMMGRIVTWGDTRRLDGAVDEVAAYSRALGPDEVAAIWSAGADGKCKQQCSVDLASVAASPASLWPPNKRMVSVHLTPRVTATCDASPICRVQTVASSEQDPGDFTVLDPLDVSLRAERLGSGNGRTYTITVVCEDHAGNRSAAASATVLVPHDQR